MQSPTDSQTQPSDFSRCVRTRLSVEICEPSVVGRVTPCAPPSTGSAGIPAGDVHENSCNPCLDFIASDATLDRYGEVIQASGWKLENYLRNPVFQNSHQYGDILFTLGKAVFTEVRGGKLYQRIEFATDVNPMAKLAYGLYKGKFLNAVSVGFVPLRWENGTEKTAFSRKYLEQELLEVSAVAIPANPNALALGLKSGAVEKSDVRDLVDLLKMTLDPARNSQPSTLNYQLLHRLAREIRIVLNS